MGNKQSQTREASPTRNQPNSTVPTSTPNNEEEIAIQNSGNISDQLQQIFTTSNRSRNSNSTSSTQDTITNDLSNMFSSLFQQASSSSSSQPASNSSNSATNTSNNANNSNSTSSSLASSLQNTLRQISGNSSRVRIFERNGAYYAYMNNRLIQLQAPKTCPYCNKQVNPFQEEYELHVVKCMTKPRIKSVTFEVTADHKELLSGDKECMICYDEYEIGQMVSRLECFCIFHKSCLENWLSRKQCCPLHMDSNSASAGDS